MDPTKQPQPPQPQPENEAPVLYEDPEDDPNFDPDADPPDFVPVGSKTRLKIDRDELWVH